LAALNGGMKFISSPRDLVASGSEPVFVFEIMFSFLWVTFWLNGVSYS
jgi:hypothetical protein